MIIPKTIYVGTTRENDQFCNINDFHYCKVVSNNHFICESVNTLSINSNPSCEIEILTKVINIIPKSCDVRFLSGNINIWQTLKNNKWIYVQSETNKLSIDCRNSKLFELYTNGTGILKLPANCIGYTNDIQLYPKSSSIMELQVVQPKLNLINDSCCNKIKFDNIQPKVVLKTLQNVNLETLKDNIDVNRFNENLDEIINQPHIVQYSKFYVTVDYVILTSIIIFVIIIALRYCKFGRRGCCFKKEYTCNEIVPENPNPQEQADRTSEVINETIPLPRLRLSP